jgi:hypothetical protein
MLSLGSGRTQVHSGQQIASQTGFFLTLFQSNRMPDIFLPLFVLFSHWTLSNFLQHSLICVRVLFRGISVEGFCPIPNGLPSVSFDALFTFGHSFLPQVCSGVDFRTFKTLLPNGIQHLGLNSFHLSRFVYNA